MKSALGVAEKWCPVFAPRQAVLYHRTVPSNNALRGSPAMSKKPSSGFVTSKSIGYATRACLCFLLAVASAACNSGVSRMSLQPKGDETGGDATSPSLSADGRFLVYSAAASNLSTSDLN